VSSATVHAHLATIYKKLDAHDRSEARRIFLRLYGGG
jgi:DNA-binding NarL/FixJ family response regulator